MQNLVLMIPDPILGTLGAKWKFSALIVSFVQNLLLSVGNVQLPALSTF